MDFGSLDLAAVFGDQLVDDMLGHAEARAGAEEDVRPEPRQGEDERVRRPAVFQVPPEGDLQSLDAVPLLEERIEVAEGLGGMLVAAVAGVDDRYAGVVGDDLGGAFPRVADDDDVGVAADYPGGIGDAFALGQGAGADVRGGDDAAAEPVHGGLEGEARAGARLEEKAGHDLAAAEAVLLAHVGGHFIGQGEKGHYLAVGEVVDGHQISLCQAHLSASLPPVLLEEEGPVFRPGLPG